MTTSRSCWPSSLSRRSALAHIAGLAGASVMASLPAGAQTLLPYGVDPSVRLRRMDQTWLWRRGCGSDQWPHTAVDSNTIVSGWGDGWGIERPSGEAKSAIGFTRFSGSAIAPEIEDVWSDRLSSAMRERSLKPQALLTVDGEIYVYANSLTDDRDRTLLFKMPGDGSGFTLVADSVIRRAVEGLQVVGAVHDQPLAQGDTILLLAEHGGLQSALLYVEEPKNPIVWAARPPSGTLGNSAKWEWFCGHDSTGIPIWSPATVHQRAFATSSGFPVMPVFSDPRGAGKHVMISYCPSLSGYMLAKTQNWLELGLFYGPTPLGPWTTLWYGPFVPPGHAPDPQIFTAQLVTNWSHDGTVSIMWSGAPRPAVCADPGSGNYDAVHLTRFAVEPV